MNRNWRAHLGQFSLYALSGGTSAVADFGSYFFFLHVHVWYVAASLMSGIIGFFTAFLLHKYVVFRKNDDFLKHLRRYFCVELTNNLITTGLLFVLVHELMIDPRPARFIAIAPVILWNFFVYKMFVYV